ncbi:MAG: hypothetical protein JRI25_28785, partial [Deltaproteobacteria bacterium]|nr:hypothetical protein [Deltaproteobacteria bacterium]
MDDLLIYNLTNIDHETDPSIDQKTLTSDDDCSTIYDRGLLVYGTILYQACSQDGFQIQALGDRTSPTVLSTVPVVGKAYRFARDGNTLYVSTQQGGLQVFDISTATAPVLVGAYTSSYRNISEFALAPGAVAQRNSDTESYEFLVLPPALPSFGATFATTDEARRAAVLGHLVSYDLSQGDWLKLLDASDPYALTALGEVAVGAELPAHRVGDYLVTGEEYGD